MDDPYDPYREARMKAYTPTISLYVFSAVLIVLNAAPIIATYSGYPDPSPESRLSMHLLNVSLATGVLVVNFFFMMRTSNYAYRWLRYAKHGPGQDDAREPTHDGPARMLADEDAGVREKTD